MKNKFKAILASIIGSATVATSAMATPATLTLPSSVDLSALFPFATLIVGALVGMIVIRKAIKTTNRS